MKNGAARLAAALRTPILPVIVRRDGIASGQIFFSEPIIPPAGLKHSETEKFAQTTMQSLYALMESAVHALSGTMGRLVRAAPLAIVR